MKLNYSRLLLLVLGLFLGEFVFAQSPCGGGPGDQTGDQGAGGGKKGGGSDSEGYSWEVRRVHSADPNDILGPVGYQDKRWVAAKEKLGYRIRFENNHEVATAPAQNIFIRQPIDSNININSLRLGSFGFGYFTFEVPPNTSLYTARLDVKDSLGIYVDVIAGIDVVKHELFWTFKSIDPVTGRSPENALVGILLVNDSTITRFNDTLPNRGEGFVTYVINAKNNVKTGDTAAAKAIIVFDTNEEIGTNTWVNSFDALPPASRALSTSVAGDSIIINWSGQDDANGAGIKEYAVYVSENSGAFTLYKKNMVGQSVAFTGTPGTLYGFFTLATDQVGNTEPLKNTAEVTVQLGNCITGTYYPDVDGDGHGAATGGVEATDCDHPVGYIADNSDCNDNNNTIYPGAPELCDGIDNNCNNQVDESVQLITWYRDADSDGYGTRADSLLNCAQPGGYVSNHTDCNDASNAIHPGAPEICDGIDNNCNGQIDEGFVAHTYYKDADADGFGSNLTVTACSETAPAGYVSTSGDCNDNDAAVHPGATELCNGKDDNCNGQLDEGCNLTTWYRDADSDGYGNADSTIQGGTRPAGYVAQGGDCNDHNVYVHPSASDPCNGVDDNCNGQIDEEGCERRLFYRDVDGDGYGVDSKFTVAVIQPAGYSPAGGDCNDNNLTIHPNAPELPNGIDDNCNGIKDEGLTVYTYYRDADGDGYGNEDNWKESTGPAPAGYILQGGDCNDREANIRPGMAELPNGKDDNCNGQVDEGLTVFSYFRDVDGDGYGNEDKWKESTGPAPAGYVLQGGDCNDNNAAIHPGVPELPNAKDDNCDGQVDEGLPVYSYYRDADGDGYGNEDKWKESTGPAPAGYILQGGDCNDNNAAIHPGALEIAGNRKDDNCNGEVDEVFITAAARSAVQEKAGSPAMTFNVVISPIPSKSIFNVYLQGSNTLEKVEVRVFDHVGRLVESRVSCSVGQQLKIGEQYAKGLYFVEAVQGNTRKLVKIIKL